MTDVTVYGFPISTFVNIVRLVLTHKGVAFDFHDLEPEMGSPGHLSLHPFNRVPILEHAGFRIYETSAIAARDPAGDRRMACANGGTARRHQGPGDGRSAHRQARRARAPMGRNTSATLLNHRVIGRHALRTLPSHAK